MTRAFYIRTNLVVFLSMQDMYFCLVKTLRMQKGNISMQISKSNSIQTEKGN